MFSFSFVGLNGSQRPTADSKLFLSQFAMYCLNSAEPTVTYAGQAELPTPVRERN